MHSGYRVGRSAVVQRSAVMSGPGTANDVDGLLQCGDGLRWVETPSPDGLDGVPEEPRAQSESKRPSLSRSRVAAALATMTGDRSAMLSTLDTTRTRSVLAATQLVSVIVSR